MHPAASSGLMRGMILNVSIHYCYFGPIVPNIDKRILYMSTKAVHVNIMSVHHVTSLSSDNNFQIQESKG